MTFERHHSPTEDFEFLVSLLDTELQIRDGADHPFYAQFNTLDKINHYLVAYEESIAVGCGAFRKYDEHSAEIKRMFVAPLHRGKGIAYGMLTALEKWAFECGYKACVLETGYNQPEAIGLYRKAGYVVIANYGPYQNVTTSVCMRKDIPGVFHT